MSYLEKLKAQSKKNLNKLVEESKKVNSRTNSEDDRFWRAERDKSGNAFAIIRFLPIPEVDADNEKALPWVMKYSHGFQNKETGMWYIEDSLSTINKEDPVAKVNRALWNSGSEADKEKARQQKRKVSYYSNIYVVKDAQNPDNEGKVFLFRYGKKIYDKILNVINPDEAFGDEPKDPFDLFQGLDFKLKIRTVEGYPNYDLSEWSDSKPISHANGEPLTEDEIEAVLKGSHSLLDLISPDKFKSYEELEKRLNQVLGQEDEGVMTVGRPVEKKTEPKVEKKVETKKEEPKKEEESEDDDLDFDSLLSELDD